MLTPARGLSSVVTTMLGRHPALYGFPELALFRAERIGALFADPPQWRGVPASQRLSGVLRALAQVHDGSQDGESIGAARTWLAARKEWRVEDIYDHLLGLVAPRTGVEKSPENSNREDYLARLATAYPRARFLHLTRHPVTSIASMFAAWSVTGYWDIPTELYHQFCWGAWYYHHSRILRFTAQLPPERWMRVRAEDLLNAPRTSLPRVCAWLGIDFGGDAVDAMCRPEESPFASVGPSGAAGGNDPSFLASPQLRETSIPGNVTFPREWIIDPWSKVAAASLAHFFGY